MNQQNSHTQSLLSSENNQNNFSLNHLLKPFDFPSYPQDQIKGVKIISFCLKPHNDSCYIILKVPDNDKSQSIYDLVAHWFDFNDPFVKIFVIKEVEISIEFFVQNAADATDLHLVKVKDCGNYILNQTCKQKEQIIIKSLKNWQLIK